MPDISRLVIEVDSKGVITATGNLENFVNAGKKAGKSSDDLAKNFGAFQLVINKLPGPLKSVASGLLGMVTPATAVVSVILELTESFVKLSKEGVAAYQEQEVQLARVGAVLQSTGAKAWTTSKDLHELSVSLQESTGRSANEIMQMQSVLLGFTNITGENFERLTRNMIDMADVMGGSLTASANAFGKALDTPSESISALTRYGFKFTEEQKRMIKAFEDAGNIAEAQVVILESMEKAFGGSAEATRDATKSTRDYELAMSKLKIALGENVANDPLVKWWQSVRTESVEALVAIIEYMNVRNSLGRAYKAVESGNATDDQELWVTQRKIARMREYIEDYNAALNNIFRRPFVKESYLAQANEMLSEAIEQERIIRDRISEAREIEKELYTLEQNRQNRSNKIAEIEALYEKTEEGRVASVERQINKLLDLRESIWETSTGVFEGISGEYKRQIDVIVDDLRKSKKELTEWQRIFKSAMGLSDTDTRQNWFKRQTTSISEFVKMLSTANDRAKILSDTFGTDMTNSLEQAATAWEKIAEGMIMSGEWQADTELFLQIVEYAREARDAFNEANLDNLISDLNTEFSLLKMTTDEMERQKLISDYQVDNEKKITEALELQNKIRAQAGINNMISGASGLSVEKFQGLNTFEEKANKIIQTFFQDLVNNVFLDKNFQRMGLMSDSEFSSNRLSSVEKEESIWREMYSMTFTSEFREMSNTFGITAREFVEFQNMITSKLKESNTESREMREKHLIDDVLKKIKDAGKSTYELAVQRLAEEQRISEEAAKQLIAEQKKLDYIKNGADWMGEIMTSIDDALRAIREAQVNGTDAGNAYSQYAVGSFAEAGMKAIQGSDVGNFVEGFQAGGPIVGIINTLVGALANVLGGMEGIEIILSPITNMLKELEPTIKALMLPTMFVAKLLEALAKAINWLLNFITFGLIEQMADLYDTLLSTNDERKKEEERLRALNEQYAKLYAALKIQEEYYLQQRRHLNSEWAIENFQSVNDMILSPHGVFSTDPEDYIIATKHPESLMSGGAATVNVTVINNANATVSTQERTGADGAKEIQIIVDGLVQQGMASGKYDGAFDAMSSRRSGKRITA
jgi:hypothetical protein